MDGSGGFTLKRTDRLLAIVIALQHKPETAQRLADKFEVSKRTILRDMQSLSEMGVPLYAETGPRGGYRLMEGYQLPPLKFDAGEALTVLFALRSLTKLADTPFAQSRWTAADKIRAVLPDETLQQIDPLLNYVEFDVPERSVRAPFLPELLAYAAGTRWMRALYRSERRRRWLTLLPKRIYASQGFWYCEAYSAEHGERRTFRADRMERIEAAEQPSDADAGSGDRDARQTAEAPSVRIVAKLTYRGAMLAEQDAHIGERVKQLSEHEWELDFHCPASEWEWAVRFFFTLGTDAEVLTPESLRAELFAAARRLGARYRPPEDTAAEMKE